MTSGIINVGVSVTLGNYALCAKPTDKSVICMLADKELI